MVLFLLIHARLVFREMENYFLGHLQYIWQWDSQEEILNGKFDMQSLQLWVWLQTFILELSNAEIIEKKGDFWMDSEIT